MNEEMILEIRILDELDNDERSILAKALTVVAPDLLEKIVSNIPLTPGPRLRLDDVLADYAQRVMTPDYRHTPESEEIERLLGRLRRIQPVQWERLKGGTWKKGDPIPRGMARYEEIEDDA